MFCEKYSDRIRDRYLFHLIAPDMPSFMVS